MNEMIFSWAEDASGKMVHVDDVRQGLKCGCTCPCCHEQLQARHGEIRAHGFAHHSEIRRANLRICYMVIMYKLAEQIINKKRGLGFRLIMEYSRNENLNLLMSLLIADMIERISNLMSLPQPLMESDSLLNLLLLIRFSTKRR